MASKKLAISLGVGLIVLAACWHWLANPKLSNPAVIDAGSSATISLTHAQSSRLPAIVPHAPLSAPANWLDPYDTETIVTAPLEHADKILADEATIETAKAEAQKRWEKLSQLPTYDPIYARTVGELREISREALAKWNKEPSSRDFRHYALLAAERMSFFEGIGHEMWSYAKFSAEIDPTSKVERLAVRELIRAGETHPRAATVYAKKILEMAPDTSEAGRAHYELARIYARDSRRAPLAFLHFIEASKKSQESQTKHLALRGAYKLAGIAADEQMLVTAITALLSDELQKPSDYPKLILERANAFFRLKQFEKSMSDCKRIKDDFPKSGQAGPAAKLQEKIRSAVFANEFNQ